MRGDDGLAQGLDVPALGGQALVEGVLVRSLARWAVAIRRKDGSIHTEAHPVTARLPRLQHSVLRGPVGLVDALSVGTRAMAIALRESTGVSVTPEQLRVTFIPVGIGVLAVFIALPGVLSARFGGIAGDAIEAGMRASMLLVYLLAVARSGEARRLFSYHGAEHKVIAAYERHCALPTQEQAGAESTVHVRCGTDFISIFMISSGVMFSFVPRHPLWWGGVLRVVLVPIVAAVAYETMRACARWPREFWALLLTWPGRALQRITTREPTPEQLEVALASLRTALSA